ncbi:MAG: bifunctional (p)ppGpp synthetase/guanosine-3',5'-bis(diphosphate) 3'-pyrophosphohydrolase [Clostridia bacterium]|nr:bifunctional (p)ppGpp synthetase/guanosine-3',5'-bis(diphosphate) 3'-pyrophosphohydrolase [Clostridia bacterium]
MSFFDEVINFATAAHSGMLRKSCNIPYILHPMEAATIAASMTNDINVIGAALLHDTVEDTPVTLEEIRQKFGDRIADLVKSETENKREGLPPEHTWQIRKEESLKVLRDTDDIGIKILWLSDKLSNMRAYYRQYNEVGDALWQNFNQKDKKMQFWYYNTIAELLIDLKDFEAWKEYKYLLGKVFNEESK